MKMDRAVEYAIEIPDRGYIDRRVMQRVVSDPDGIRDRRDALELLASTMRQYDAMGCPEIAKTVRLVSRAVTVTRGDWEPV